MNRSISDDFSSVQSTSNGYQSFRNPAASINDEEESEATTSGEKSNSEVFLKINTDPEEHEEEVSQLNQL